MQLCPVCAWEDAPGDLPSNNSRETCLARAQREFLATGASEAEFLSAVRLPTEEEERSPDWISFDELRLRVIADIERVFHDVRRDGGTTLHQMDLWDAGLMNGEGSALEAGPLVREAESKDPEVTWQEITAEKLSQFSFSLVFLDDRGYRFYLPAFMKHALVTCDPQIGMSEYEGVLWSLTDGMECSLRRELFADLTTGEKQVVASFVHLFAVFGDECQSPDGCKALRNGWDAFVPDFLKLALS